ncbi:hypothetical protein F5887DRAFT_928339, partial [Amanita rubescens]
MPLALFLHRLHSNNYHAYIYSKAPPTHAASSYRRRHNTSSRDREGGASFPYLFPYSLSLPVRAVTNVLRVCQYSPSLPVRAVTDVLCKLSKLGSDASNPTPKQAFDFASTHVSLTCTLRRSSMGYKVDFCVALVLYPTLRIRHAEILDAYKPTPGSFAGLSAILLLLVSDIWKMSFQCRGKTSNAEKAGGAAVADDGSISGAVGVPDGGMAGNKTFMTSGAVGVPDGGSDIARRGAAAKSNNLGQRRIRPAWVFAILVSFAPKFFSSSEAAGKRRCKRVFMEVMVD